MTLWAYDIETENWDRLVIAVALADDGRIHRMRTDQECGDWYRSLPPEDVVLSHNGGRYDFLQLIAATPDLEWHAQMAGSAIIYCRAEGHAECRDSYRVFMASLKNWCGLTKDVGLACVCGRDCGGYCAIRVGMSEEHYRLVTEYCERDCEALLRQWQADIPRLAACGLEVYRRDGSPRGTVGSIAWQTGARMAGVSPYARISADDYGAGRLGYYGGRTEVGATVAPEGHRYDIHAAYPAALTQGVPIGRRTTVRGSRASSLYRSGAPGIWRADVILPESDLPQLPHRCDGNQTIKRLTDGRLVWATGHISGNWTTIELQNAEASGAKIVQIYRGSVWSGLEPIFRPYVEHIYAERRKALDDADERWAAILKWYANALSGKLAQRAGGAKLVITTRPPAGAEGWEPVGITGKLWAIPEPWRVPYSAHPAQAAYLTSRTRVTLYERLSRHEGSWLYCDTDSTYLTSRDDAGTHESALGTFGYEGSLRDWLALAPKLYRFRDESGKDKVRARGVPKAAWDDLDELQRLVPDEKGRLKPKQIEKDGGVKLLRRSPGSFARETVKRRHLDAGTDWCGTRRIESNGRTRPLHRTKDGMYE